MDVDASQNDIHWNRTRNLMIVHMAIWFVFSFLIHWFASTLNNTSLLQFPLGFYMAAQGSLAMFVIQLFIFVQQQDKIDRECGIAED